VSRYWSKKSCPSNAMLRVPAFISASQRYQNRTKQKRNKKTIGFFFAVSKQTDVILF
jgi:hypothetical protein